MGQVYYFNPVKRLHNVSIVLHATYHYKSLEQKGYKTLLLIMWINSLFNIIYIMRTHGRGVIQKAGGPKPAWDRAFWSFLVFGMDLF